MYVLFSVDILSKVKAYVLKTYSDHENFILEEQYC